MTGVFHFMALSLGLLAAPRKVWRPAGAVNQQPQQAIVPRRTRRLHTLFGFLLGVGAIFAGALQAPAASEKGAPRFTVLVFSKTAGYRHNSIPAGIAAIAALGAEHGFAVDSTEDAARFSDAALARYNAVIFLNTTGDILDRDEKAAFERYIRAGAGFVGIHSASDTEYRWPFYGRLVGAHFASHPEIQRAAVRIADRNHASTRNLPAVWGRTDEWYNFASKPRGAVRVLAILDETSYSGGRMGADHPIAWCQQDVEGGRSWYTGMGHTVSSYSEPLFRVHLLGGIESVAATAGGCVGPER